MLLSQGCIWFLFPLLTLVLSESTSPPSVETSTLNGTSSTPDPSTTASDLKEESQDQVAILKQINRVNDDGSYTFGYEAADGSFKIETRDVVGNVKGMFGFVDESGELKRISYTASNGTGFQTTGSPNVPPLIAPDVETNTRISLQPALSTPRPNLPVYIYKTTTLVPRPEVIQHIPKLRPTPASHSTEPTESEEVTDTNVQRPGYGTVLPRKSSTPNFITFSTTTGQPEEIEATRPSFVQIIRPRGYKRVFVTKRPIETSTVTPTTNNYSSTYSTDLSEEMMEPGDMQRQVESNSLAETGLLTSGTEDSPDVFGGESTVKPYPAGAYQALFPPLPQYQRILQGAYGQNPSTQIPPTGPDGQYPGPNLETPGRLNQNPYLQQYLSERRDNPRPPGVPFQDPRAALDPNPQAVGRLSQNQFFQQYLSAQGQGFPSSPRTQDPRLPPPQPENPKYSKPTTPSGQDIRARLPTPSSIIPDARQYQGLAFPSGRPVILPPPGARGPLDYSQSPNGRALPLPPTGGPIPEAPYPIEPTNGRQSISRRPQTLPPSSYNPQQGLPISDPDAGRRASPTPGYPPYQDARDEQTNAARQSYIMEQILRMLLGNQQGRSQPQLSHFQQALLASLGMGNLPADLSRGPNYGYGPLQGNRQQLPFAPAQQPYQEPYGPPQQPYGPVQQPYGPSQQPYRPVQQPYGNPQQPYGPVQQPYGPVQQPYGLFQQQYGPPQQPYGPGQQPYGPPQQPYGPAQQQPYGPRQQAYGPIQPYGREPPYGPYGPHQPFAPPVGPHESRYPNTFPDPYAQLDPYLRNPYQGYNPYVGRSLNPYNQFNPEEAILRMFLGQRYPASLPNNSPQIQNSQAYDSSSGDSSRQPSLNSFEQSVPGQIFGQRINPEGGIVHRSSSSDRGEIENRQNDNARGEPSQRSTTYAPREDFSPKPRQSFVQRVFPSQRSRNKGSRNVQILDDSVASKSTTTAKP